MKQIITRKIILKRAKRYLRLYPKDNPGICSALMRAKEDFNIKIPNQILLPLFSYPIAVKKFHARYNNYWWKPSKFGIFSRRRWYLNWLIWKYRNDTENLFENYNKTNTNN